MRRYLQNKLRNLLHISAVNAHSTKVKTSSALWLQNDISGNVFTLFDISYN